MRGGTIEVGTQRMAIRKTYAEVAAGSPVAVVGSSGFIEIAVRDGDAARVLGLSRGSAVILRPS
jgi:S-adenosylmethionine hydrolase